ncbi:hypothetical protein [Microbacterium sp. NPDC056052]|uniref:hypothetical protein n=1 Tax=Microbacterium sp. NPDC056052 TaxID=3345695 RepID=UPI0035E2B652
MTTPVTELALALLDTDGLPASMRDRALIASITSTTRERTPLAPNFASDLGVRTRSDAEVYLSEVASMQGIDVDSYLRRLEPDQVLQVITENRKTAGYVEATLDALLNFAGQWTLVAAIAPALLAEPEHYGTGELTYAAAALSAVKNPAARTGFTQAVDSAATSFSWSMATIRLAAWLIKRANNLDAGEAILGDREARIDALVRERRISCGDGEVMKGVGHNLRALIWTKRKNGQEANASLSLARTALRSNGLVCVGASERNRYYAQSTVNQIQLEAMQHGFDTAYEASEEHLTWARESDPTSVTEALSLTGYMAYRSNKLNTAEAHLVEAISRLELEGAPTQLSAVRKAMIATLHVQGRDEQALLLLDQLQRDPAGLDRYRIAA